MRKNDSFSGKVVLKRPFISDTKSCLCMYIVQVSGRQSFKPFSQDTEHLPGNQALSCEICTPKMVLNGSNVLSLHYTNVITLYQDKYVVLM